MVHHIKIGIERELLDTHEEICIRQSLSTLDGFDKSQFIGNFFMWVRKSFAQKDISKIIEHKKAREIKE
jgi:hypothetical protein